MVQDFDEFFDQLVIEKQKTEKAKKAVKKKTVPKKSPYKLSTAADSLSLSAKRKLENYLKKSPQFKVLNDQLNILMSELKTYMSVGDTENADKCRGLIKDLQLSKNKFTKQFKEKNFQKDKAAFIAKSNKSEKILSLRTKLSDLEKQYKNYNPNSLIFKMQSYRNELKILNIDNQIVNVVEDFDDFIDEPQKQDISVTKIDYNNLCAHIADIIGISASEVADMSLNKLKKLLVEYSPDISDIVSDIEETKFNISNELNVLRGNEDITNIIFDTFDFETVEEELPKEMLAASNVDLVKGIAFNICSKMNMLHNMNDAIAYGLLGLTVAINKWYSIQKLKDTAVSFTGFANIYIANNIKKGLIELTSGGMISKNVMATLLHKRDKQIKSYITNNPELKDMPTEMLETIIESTEIIQKPSSVVTEGEYTDIVGGSEGGSDIWSNVASDDNGEKLITAKFEYENLLKSIKTLFSLFETKTDKETGIEVKTNRKIFDQFDYKLFKLSFGLEYKKDEFGKTTDYSQAEIAQIMTNFAQSLGYASKTFSQSSISTRVQSMINKIKDIIDLYPELKVGFEYIWNYHQSTFTEPDQFPDDVRDLNTNIDDDFETTQEATISDILDKDDIYREDISDIFNQ